MASVTYQNLFRMFGQLAGMTGTAATDSAEFMEVYRLAVFQVPTNKPMIRKDLPDERYIAQTPKLIASLKTVHQAYEAKRPILIETGSLSLSNLYSRLLLREKIPHSLLNARSASKEARIVAEAGQLGAVTVATSMAGRGTDIKLGEGVKEKGGLLVLGTERMANRRVDNQLRGRAGRQGEPGSSIFYTSLEDRIVIQNAPKWVRRYTYKHAHDEHQQLGKHGRFRKVIDRAQDQVSNTGRSARFSTLQYGEVFRVQRDTVYETRDEIMVAPALDNLIAGVFRHVAEQYVKEHRNGDISDFLDFVYTNIDRDFLPKLVADNPERMVDVDYIQSLMKDQLNQKRAVLQDDDQWHYFQRVTVLKTIDTAWIDQVDNLQALQAVTMNRSTNGRDPLYEYQKETRRTFGKMKQAMNVGIARNLLCSDLVFNEDGTIEIQFP